MDLQFDYEDETSAGLRAAAEEAKQRYGDLIGFDTVLFYVNSYDIFELVPDFPGTILQDIVALTTDYFNYITSNQIQLPFITKLLTIAASNGPGESQALANRILRQMELDENGRRRIRRPIYIVLPVIRGFAIAVIIDDRFWTDEW
jgi:hypothetical protein